MISTRRQLALLAAIALVLAIALVVDLVRPAGGPLERSLVPGLDVADVTSLEWERAGEAGRERVELVREGDRWQLVAPVRAEASARAVTDVLSALRAARWQRRSGASAAGEATTTLAVQTSAGDERVLAFGQALSGTEQAWIVAGDHALLVDRWIVRALTPAALDLVVRRPFEGADAGSISLTDDRGTLRLEGAPPRLVEPGESVALLVAPQLAEELARAVADLELVALGAVRGPEPSSGAITIAVGDTRGTLGGTCDRGPASSVGLVTPSGSGCVTRDAAEAVRAAIERLRGSPAELVERRPAPVDAATITLPDGAVLDLTKQPRLGDHAADPVRVAELLAVLAAPAEVVPLPPGAPVPQTLTVTDRAGATIVLELLAPQLVRRAGEPVALRLTSTAWHVLTRSGRELRDPTLWVEEPLAIETLAIGDVVYARGAVIGEWTRTRRGGSSATIVSPGNARRLDALADALASVRALGDAPAFTPVLEVVVTVAQPSGPDVVRSLALGRKTRGACPARIGDERLLLDAAVCDDAMALARP